MAVLEELCRLQVRSIAFENLDPFLGRPLGLDSEALQAKLIHGGRGGYCFELNPLLQHALTGFGFDARGLAARVFLNAAPGVLPPRTHVLLRVILDGEDWLADVGFGRFTPTGPLRLEPGLEQETPNGLYRVDRAEAEYELRTLVADEWRLLYRFNLIEQFLIDRVVHNHFVATHPSSFFRRSIVAALATEGGRHVLLDDRLAFQANDGAREERVLPNAESLQEELSKTFQIHYRDISSLKTAFDSIKLNELD